MSVLNSGLRCGLTCGRQSLRSSLWCLWSPSSLLAGRRGLLCHHHFLRPPPRRRWVRCVIRVDHTRLHHSPHPQLFALPMFNLASAGVGCLGCLSGGLGCLGLYGAVLGRAPNRSPQGGANSVIGSVLASSNSWSIFQGGPCSWCLGVPAGECVSSNPVSGSSPGRLVDCPS